MKKVILGIVILLVVAVSGSHALIGLGVGGAYNMASDPATTGLALDVNLPFPIIPLFDTRLEANLFQASSGSITFNMTPVMLTQTFNFPMLPVYAGFGVGTVLLSSSDSSFVAPSTVLSYSGYVGYKKSIMAMTDLFIQGGYVSSKFDIAPGVSYDSSGVEVKGGIRFGI